QPQPEGAPHEPPALAAPGPGSHEPQDPREAPRPHESPAVMTWPMIVLAIGSIGAGAFLIINERLVDFLAPVTGAPARTSGVFTAAGLGALGLTIVAALIAWAMYGRRQVPAVAPAARFPVVAARKD